MDDSTHVTFGIVVNISPKMPHSRYSAACLLQSVVVQQYLNSRTFKVILAEYQCDQIKKLPKCFHKLPKNINSSFYITWSFSKLPKSQQSFRTTFVSESVPRTFKNHPIWSHCRENSPSSLYSWPPVSLIWIQLLCWCWINKIFTYKEIQEVKYNANIKYPTRVVHYSRNWYSKGHSTISIIGKRNKRRLCEKSTFLGKLFVDN